MYKITKRTPLSENVTFLEVLAPDIAKNAQPGQFVILRLGANGERIPLTIAGKDKEAGTIDIIFQTIGKTTYQLNTLKAGDSISDVLGPLGHPTEIKKLGTVICIAGGVGAAEILPIAEAFKNEGNEVFTILGARTKELLILTEELKTASSSLHLITDDGSSGRKGFVTDVLDELLTKNAPIALVYAIGPVPMMKAVTQKTRDRAAKTIVSLNPIMLDGTGMCGACRVTVGKKTCFACVDGPEFDGHEVNWDELSQRLALFKEKEKLSLDNFLSDKT